MLRLGYCLIFLLFSSCGYQVLSPSVNSGVFSTDEEPSFYVENIQGDEQGILQNHIVSALLKRNYRYCCDKNRATFNVKISPLEKNHENIGFTYVAKTTEHPNRNFLISNESKLEIHAEINLESPDGSVLHKFIVKEGAYYDFQPDLGTENILNFSLGQFEMYNGASRAAQQELYGKLGDLIAQRISYELA